MDMDGWLTILKTKVSSDSTMPRSKPVAKRSTGLYEVRQPDGSVKVESCIARKKPKPLPRADTRVEECVCAKDCTGVCHDCSPEDHYSAWCVRCGPPPNGYPYTTPEVFQGYWAKSSPLVLRAPSPANASDDGDTSDSSDEVLYAPKGDITPPFTQEVNPCVECGFDMGPGNPRQYCGKTQCLGYGLDYDSDETECIDDFAPVYPEEETPKPADEPGSTDLDVIVTKIELPNPYAELYPEIPPYEWNVFMVPKTGKPVRAIDLSRLTRNTINKVNHYFPWLIKAYPEWDVIYESGVNDTMTVSEFIADKLYCLYGVFERNRIASA